MHRVEQNDEKLSRTLFSCQLYKELLKSFFHMRNYVEMFLATYHLHKDVPPIDVDGEVWRGTLDELDARVVELRADFEAAGYVFTETARGPAYWELNKANFVQIITDFADVDTLFGYSTGEDPILVFESPRKREKRRFRLVPIVKKA